MEPQVQAALGELCEKLQQPLGVTLRGGAEPKRPAVAEDDVERCLEDVRSRP